MDVVGCSRVHGRVRAHRVSADGTWLNPLTGYSKNLILYQWAELTAKLLSTGDSRYRISGMYLEFQNVANPGDTVSAPSFGRDRNIQYYNDLSTSSDTDYLRVPLTAVNLQSEGVGLSNNQMVYFARSAGLAGVHGKPFSFSSNSVIYGLSLVAMPDAADATQDLLFSSFYFESADQQQKLESSQIGLEWTITLQ